MSCKINMGLIFVRIVIVTQKFVVMIVHVKHVLVIMCQTVIVITVLKEGIRFNYVTETKNS